MSYDPSHRKPPRQERWPQATPPDAWPSYQDDGTYPDGEHADSRYAADRQGAYPATPGYQHQAGYQGASDGPGDRGYQSAVATDTFPPARNGYSSSAGYGSADGYGDARDGYGPADGYGDARDGYGPPDGYGDARDGYGPPDGYGDARDGYDWTENGYGGAGNSNGYGTGAFPSGRQSDGTSGFAGATGEFTRAANGYGSARSGYAGTVGGYPGAADGYADAGDSFAGTADRYSRTESGYGQATDEYPTDPGGYDWSQNGHAGAAAGYAGGADTFAGTPDDFAGTLDGYAGAPDGYAGARNDFMGSAGYLGPDSYTEPGLSDPVLMAPDVGVDPDRWQADQDLRREAGRRGLAVGAVTGFLATAVAIGVSTLAAALVRAQASPMAALGSVFIDRTPAALKNAMMQHFGANGRIMLLLGMYTAIAVLAVGIGMLARQAAGSGVAGLAAFSLIAAFVTVTRPGGRVIDVAPAIIGGIAGVAALLWLLQASAPTPPPRQARRNDRRRA